MQLRTKSKTKLMIALSVLAFFILIQLITLIGGVDTTKFICLDSELTTTVYKHDGSVEHYEAGGLGGARAGDVIEVKVPIEEYLTEEPQSLCFYMYNAQVEVYNGGRYIHGYGQEQMERKQLIGDVMYTISFPPESDVEGLTLRIIPQTGFTVGFLRGVFLIPSGECRLYPLIGQEFSFYVIVGIFAFSLLFGIILFFLRFAGVKESSGIQLMLFTFFLTTWYLGYQHMFYCISNRIEFCADAEYIALYLAPIPMCRYLRGRKKCSRVIFGALSIFYTGLFLVATVLNYAHTGIYYSVTLPVMHFTMLITMICMLVFAVVNVKSTYVQERVASLGTIAFVSCVILELIRIYLEKFFQIDAPFLKTLFTSAAIIICAITLFVGYGAYVVQNYTDRQDKNRFKQIAYKDFLSGIPNRNACLEGLQDWKNRGEKCYTLFFLDVNFLKKVNDEHGHDMGDRLLVVVAKALQMSAAGAKFYGRWGGDEFLAGFEDAKLADAFEKRFQSEIKSANEGQLLPFEVSVAVGRVDSDLLTPLDPMDAVQMADQKMYQQKREAHKNRESK